MGELRGIAIYYDFRMKLLSTIIPIGGIGSVAVDILHKKKKVARDLMQHFINEYRQNGITLLTLYPFSPDFYRKMGFGYGAKKSQYRVRPSDLPTAQSGHQVVLIEEDEAEAFAQCYHKALANSNGLFERSGWTMTRLFDDPNLQIAAYKNGNKISGISDI